MKFFLFFLFAILLGGNAGAQRVVAVADTSLHTVELNEVIIRNSKPEKFSSSVRSQHVYIVFRPTTGGDQMQYDSTYFMTQFSGIENHAISLYTVTMRLHAFDTGLFNMDLVIYQANTSDTIFKVIPLDASAIQKNQLKVSLFEENISLQPGTFYLGYGFHPKKIAEPYRYRMYATSNGECGMLIFKDGVITFTTNAAFPYKFPFKVTYKTM